MSKINFDSKKILVIGAARSGLSVAKLLKRAGADVVVAEAVNNGSTRQAADILRQMDIAVQFGAHHDSQLRGMDLVVPSPGISPSNQILAEAASRDIPIFSEVEIAWHNTEKPIIAVTGTNGKTTTASLIGEILNAAGKKGVVAGNIGYPLSEAVAQDADADYLVAEVSSFQLEFTHKFRPKVAVMLNLTPDHLDWHGSSESYALAKSKIFANQGDGDIAILNADDEAVAAIKTRGKRYFFSRNKIVSGAYAIEGEIMVDIGGPALWGRTTDIRIIGGHNLENSLAAITAAAAIGIEDGPVMDVLKSFAGVEHRLELAGERGGVLYYNDSKATNPEAAIRGINSFERPVILVAGGRNKGNTFDALAETATVNVKTAFLIGEAAPDIAREFEKKRIDVVIVASLNEATEKAAALAIKGDVVLLSPACASYDMFRDYEERGRLFKDAVRRLKGMGKRRA